MSRRSYAEVAEKIERLKELAEDYAENDHPDPWDDPPEVSD
ncbi:MULTISPECIES: hypothetical protein [Halolamina]|uniref:Uncharacterized protein n=2 Tax=Halolamina TaxID=1075397 RepID=A0A1I5WDG2_9EURY|nr:MULTISPECIES: hypothetical protein [Halolamina]SFQ17366.1 hypothetical protein SAMN05216277_1276 [Halolamina pelagica]